MIHIRRLLAGFLATALIAFAPASFAAQPDKLFTLSMSSASLSGVLTATITNASPPQGNSTINSASLSLVGSAWQIQSASSSNGRAVVTPDFKSVQVTGMSPVKPQKSFTVTITLKSFTCGDSALWDAVPWTGSSLSGTVFNYAIPPQTDAMRTSTTSCDGSVTCGQALAASATGDGVIEAQRLLYNKDGSTCSAVNYDFTNQIVTSNSTLMQWDTLSQAPAAFEYTVTWKPTPADPATGLPFPTKVAWYVNGSLIPPVPAHACTSPDAPAPYGTLDSDVGLNDLQIFVTSTVTLPAVNFPIVIDKERMLVTAVSGHQWTVTRGAGGTIKATHTKLFASDSTPKPAMSTPLPLDSAGNVMQMCIVDETWTSTDPSQCSLTDGSTACILKTTHAFDLGDGYMIGN